MMPIKKILLLFVALGCASCGGNNPPPTSSSTGTLTPAAEAAAVDSASTSAIPAGAQWTIYVQQVQGPSHVAQAKRLRDQLISTTGMKQWYLVHDNSSSTLYYGYYKSIGDQSADLEKIKAMRDPVSARRLFAQVMTVAINASNPQAPEAWDLLNSGGYYTLEIATYSGGPGRKQAAVDSVREARAQGVEAYYYHGDTSSSVCIGSWPRQAAEEAAPVVNEGADHTIIVSTGPRNDSVEQTMLQAAAQRKGIDNIEKPIHVAPRFVPRDPSMIAALKKFPYRYVDGELYSTRVVDPKTHQPSLMPDPSFIVVIPRKPQSILTQENTAQQPQGNFGQAVYGQPQQQTPATSSPNQQQGKLKSLGD
ncbi:MAG: hypothetical protein IT448_08125 [Phycisphaerales bacterium]|nr:hypothetical protein [Phycisphaerales bacterium]